MSCFLSLGVFSWNFGGGTFEVPTDQNTTKIPREDPQREKKNENGSGRRKKKREILVWVGVCLCVLVSWCLRFVSGERGGGRRGEWEGVG